MGERTSYVSGTFSWVENATTDQDGAKRFYGELFGWAYDDREIGEGFSYSMATIDGRHVAAIAAQMQDEREMGVPPHWNSYITVDDVDAVSARVGELGGTLHAPPFDVMEAGRMSALSDPTGAVVYLWEPRQHIGAGLVNVPGALCWNELGTRDPEAAERFWSELLGWRFDPVDTGGGPAYWSIQNAGRVNGGMRVLGDEMASDVPAHWLAYFAVESIGATVEAAVAGGGRLLVPRTQAGGANAFAVLADPAGAVFAIFEGELDP